ncbi:MAG: oligosaccharide flippase family protein [Spirochaetia bacterium]|nr:oligosaccharide flippase family protein [Spirochaetia bacterium]
MSINLKTEIHHGNQFKKIARHGGLLFTSSIIISLSSFVLIPIYTRYLSPEQYGIWASLNSITQFLGVAIGLFLGSSFSRYYFEEKRISNENVSFLFSTNFWFIFGWGILVILICILISPFTFEPLLKISFYPMIFATIVPVLFNELGISVQSYLRNTLEIGKIVFRDIVIFIISTLFILMFLIFFNMGVEALVYGAAISAILSFIFYTLIAKRKNILRFYFERKVIKKSLAYSLPLVPSIGSGVIARFSDRLMLAYFGTLDEVGLYSVSSGISRVMYFFIDAVTQVQGSISMSALTENKEKAKKQISEFLTFYIYISFFFYLGLTMFAKEFLYLFPESYQSAYKIVGLLALSPFFGGIYRPYATILSYHKKMYLISVASMLSAIFNIVGNFIFIPIFGQLGAAVSTVFSVFIFTVWIIYWSQKIDPVNHNLLSIYTAFIFGLFLLFSYYYIDIYLELDSVTLFLIKIPIFFSFFFPLFFLSSMKKVRNELLESIKSLHQKIFKIKIRDKN